MKPSAKILSTLLASVAIGADLHAFPIAQAFADTLDTPSTPQQATRHRFDIPGGPLGDVLAQFQRASGLIVTIQDEAIKTITSAGVTGDMTSAQALEKILAGTSVSSRMLSRTVVAVELRAPGASVDVTGAAPMLDSPKYTQPLRDTPQTVTVIPQQIFDEQAATSLRDVLRNTPGITLTAGEGGTAPGDNLLIRGFSARNDVSIDGARDPGVTTRDTFNTEAVEVAKGPSSVTSGRGSTGGSINLVTKTASPTDFTTVRVIGGNADSKRATIDINRRLTATSAVRVNGLWQDAGVPRRDVVTNKSWGVAPTLSLGIGRPTSLTVGYQHLHQNNIPDYGLPGTLPDLANAAGVTIDDLDFSNYYGLLARDHERMDADSATMTIDHRFSDALTLRNLTRYGRNTLDRVVTPPRAASAANAGSDPGFDASVPQIRRTDTKYQYRDDTSITNQTDLTSRFATGAVEHAAVVGLELTHDHQPSEAATDTFANGRPPVTDLFHPDPLQPYTPSIVKTGASSDARSRAAALYAFDTVTVGSHWQADVSARYDHIDVDYATVSAAGAASAFGRVDNAVSGRAGLVFKPTARGSIYGAYSTSFTPSYDGSFGLTLSASGANSQALPPERSRNVEVGAKWDVASGLSVTGAAFKMQKTNAKTTDASGATVLAGDQDVTGIELSVAGAITPRWSVFGGASLMSGRIKDSGNAAEVDKQLSYVPKSSFNVWSTYRLGSALTLGGGAQFTDGYYFNNTNALTTANAAAIQALTRYWLLSAMGSYRINRHVTLQINGTNLANARYVDRGYSGHFIPGAGRSIQIGPTITF